MGFIFHHDEINQLVQKLKDQLKQPVPTKQTMMDQSVFDKVVSIARVIVQHGIYDLAALAEYREVVTSFEIANALHVIIQSGIPELMYHDMCGIMLDLFVWNHTAKTGKERLYQYSCQYGDLVLEQLTNLDRLEFNSRYVVDMIQFFDCLFFTPHTSQGCSRTYKVMADYVRNYGMASKIHNLLDECENLHTLTRNSDFVDLARIVGVQLQPVNWEKLENPPMAYTDVTEDDGWD